ncbi:hypothetical protein [Aequorivita marina]|uniref:hypothetical protein n=1 Tax=Aequorivita marina TaxID=3073654 RepID=UPI00287BAEF1|nr:hypothetical protein [Aequorivita sp. S2608]
MMKAVFPYIIILVFMLLGCKTKPNDELEESTSKAIVAENPDQVDYNATETESKYDATETEFVEEANHLEYDPAQTLYFSHAFIYKYQNEEQELKDFWIYHNPDNGQLMYMPNDEMIDFVVSDTLGNYYFLGSDGHGAQTIGSQYVHWVANPESYNENASYPISDQYVSIKLTGKTKALDAHSTVDGAAIVGAEYKWEFSKMSGTQRTYFTEVIPVNSYQIYGFNKLEGDIQLPVGALDFIGFFGKHQTLTHFYAKGFKLELAHYEFNPAFVEAGTYQYAVREADGSWKKKPFPLLLQD